MGEDKLVKRSSFGKSIRKRLSDITNYEPQLCSSSSLDKGHVDHLLKENAGLMKLITEKNKVIEMNGIELQKVRVLLQKTQFQNWNLAQSNSHMTAELNLGKKKLKELQHQLACKDALLKTMNSEFQVKREMSEQKCESKVKRETNDQKCESKVKRETNDQKCESKDGEKALTNQQNASRRIRPGRSRSVSQLTTGAESENDIVENKRRRVRTQSARFTSQEHEADENLFEIKDLKLHDEYGPTLKVNVEQENDKCGSKSEPQNSQRMSFSRPSRRAAEKVQSYKEVPLNIKMRRPE
ncbi:putative shugoshin [Helianthus annuus]|uniref:Shugoshin n=1 Tax=Helianthus annuus TaxID=4232 RepID=A0A251SPY0_HELAN|nr:shugoshin-1 isoform X1 [Helianthus annuus]KAF5772677.1 putative shugoshin [Helianthus annuus]KAJ0480403.1 putative shugoshin [Helianthus annuus]KAJ0497092.1 putative shugoshin [Helianthus annuus]KAJ0848498.1 putative shugoshin [Helianthus annuus]KAJ0857492.1 putative shugoshin [Helianthus annuus]